MKPDIVTDPRSFRSRADGWRWMSNMRCAAFVFALLNSLSYFQANNPSHNELVQDRAAAIPQVTTSLPTCLCSVAAGSWYSGHPGGAVADRQPPTKDCMISSRHSTKQPSSRTHSQPANCAAHHNIVTTAQSAARGYGGRHQGGSGGLMHALYAHEVDNMYRSVCRSSKRATPA
jgi:hypothetical protein